MTTPSYERLGVFYLGREFDAATSQTGDDLLYDSRDLTTHAVCIGMTGSGKTGLCLSLLEEAAIDGVPAIAIDPKGDIGNLLLTFPELRAADFRPWIDEGEAARKGQSGDEFAAATAETWRKGLEEWGEDGARIARLRAAADLAIYTPGSDSGRPLSVLRSFAAPDAATLADATALRERIGSAVAGLLALIGIDADPIKSREHILLSAILDDAWRREQSPDLAGLIQAVQKPAFDKVGVFDVDSFFPARERTELALRINGLLAAPGFDAWLQGEALDIQKLLYTDDGKPRIAIISIAHLNDAERMFVVTLVANELVAWMRRQSGTTSLRALFYMDEVFGFFPPSAVPPSKPPLLTLMKQARAFGVGVVLATQNPVDLDYKGLGNAGTWLIGRLQTDRDKQRVLEGLLGSDAAGGLDRAGLESLISSLAQRTFLMRNVHDHAPRLFRSRWALSYLRGPLTLTEIRRLTPRTDASLTADADGTPPHAARGQPAAAGTDSTDAGRARAGSAAVGKQHSANARSGVARPVIEHGVTERFITSAAAGASPRYEARLGARVRAHYVNSKASVDLWQTTCYLAPVGADGPNWPQAVVTAEATSDDDSGPAPDASFVEPPAALLSARSHRSWARALEDHVYRSAALELLACPALGTTAAPGMTEGEFRAQIGHALREKRDAAVDVLRQKYATKLATLEARERRAEQKIERERSQASEKTVSSALAVGGSLLGALFGSGRRGSSISKVSTAARSVSRAGKERADVAQAESEARAIRTQVETLNTELEDEVARLESTMDPQTITLERVTVKPRKSDIEVDQLALVWLA